MIFQHSLKLRLTLFFTISSLAVLVLLSVLLNNEINKYFKLEDAHALNTKAYMMKELISKTNFDRDFASITKKMEELEGVAIRIDNPGDKIVLYVSDNIRFPASVINGTNIETIDTSDEEKKTQNDYHDYRVFKKARPPKNIEQKIESQLLEWEDKGNSYRGMQFRINFEGEDQASVLATLALNITHRDGFLNAFTSALIKLTILAVLLSAALHWFITSRGLQPLQTLSKKAKLVSGQDIKQRMPVDHLPVEIAGLSETLNNMLERLDDSFRRLENFSSDIAHELRTPINNLMMQTQVTLSKPRSKNEYLMALGSNAEEFQRLARMISDMLFLAKADNKQLLLSTETIELDQEFTDLFEFYDALAEDRNVQLSFEGKAQVQGDRLMLRRAFNNLISNALHHCFEGSTIKINITPTKNDVAIEVENTGQTIPEEVLPHLFDRFYRADKARTCSSFERVGLGLAITKSIAEAHGGKLSVTSENTVTIFKFTIKLS